MSVAMMAAAFLGLMWLVTWARNADVAESARRANAAKIYHDVYARALTAYARAFDEAHGEYLTMAEMWRAWAGR